VSKFIFSFLIISMFVRLSQSEMVEVEV